MNFSNTYGSYVLARAFFVLGVFLIPFDNLVIAPSKGWATVSPVLFFFSAFLIFIESPSRLRFSYKTIFILIFFSLISLVNYLRYPVPLSGLLMDVITIVCGLSFLFSMITLVGENKSISYNLFVDVVVKAYTFSLIYGVLYYLSFKLNVSPIISFFELIEKRWYGDRFSMSFTEPSFASLHVFGVLFFIWYFFYKLEYRVLLSEKTLRNLNIIFYVYLLSALVIVDSMRFKIDFLFFIFVVFWFVYSFKYKVYTFINLFIFAVFVSIYLVYVDFDISYTDLRIYKIVSETNFYSLVNSDASLASRFFRIFALWDGLLKQPNDLVLGYGLGNASVAFNNGYDFAMSVYTNSFVEEVNGLYQTTESQYYCMHLRIIAEFGLLVWFLIIIKLFSRKFLVLFLLLIWLYFQFDSYAFYSIWLYLFFLHINKKDTQSLEAFK